MYYRGTKPKTERPKPKPRPLKREEIKMKIIKENRFCCICDNKIEKRKVDGVLTSVCIRSKI